MADHFSQSVYDGLIQSRLGLFQYNLLDNLARIRGPSPTMFKLTPYTTTLGLSGLSLNFAVASIATCAFWLFGYDMSVMVSSISGSHCK